MKKLLIALLLLAMPTLSIADFTLVVPQKPGGGTSVWASIVADLLSEELGESVKIKHIPGARDIPGFNTWHEDLQTDDSMIMVSHGGNGISFLQETVKYNYNEYSSIALMNLNIITAMHSNVRESAPDKLSMPAGSGMVPEAMMITLYACGPLDGAVSSYIDCFKKNINWVKGMSGGERRLAFRAGELNFTRENPAAFKKHVDPLIADGDAELWLNHGILNSTTGKHEQDPNFPSHLHFEKAYEYKWGVAPSGAFYDAYKLAKSFRDGLQKALWVRKGNPNTNRLIAAMEAINTDPKTKEVILNKVGNYEWIIGKEGDNHRDYLMTLITEEALVGLVTFNAEALDLKSVFKPGIVKNK
jgi:hypothetical protein